MYNEVMRLLVDKLLVDKQAKELLLRNVHSSLGPVDNLLQLKRVSTRLSACCFAMVDRRRTYIKLSQFRENATLEIVTT